MSSFWNVASTILFNPDRGIFALCKAKYTFKSKQKNKDLCPTNLTNCIID